MFNKLLLLGFLWLFYTSISAQTFEDNQLQNSRVRMAQAEKEASLETAFLEMGVVYDEIKNIYIRGFKHEEKLEVWVQADYGESYRLFREYDFCTNSGVLGPKRRQGDFQIPEGFYFINRFNPNSNYFLSLKINYPNTSDATNSQHGNLGGQIFIHGSCQSIGCIPITDSGIMEVYLICMKVRTNGQLDIPVHIFPFKFERQENEAMAVTGDYLKDAILVNFWNEIEKGYYYFEQYRQPPFVVIDRRGNYHFF